MEISVRRIDFMDVCVKYPLTILLPFQGVVALPLLPRAPLRLPWATYFWAFSPFSVCCALSACCFQPVPGLPCALSGRLSARSRSAVRSQRAVFSPFPVCCALSADGLKAARLRGLKGQQFHSPGQAKRHPGYCRWRELTPCKGKSLKNHQSLNTNSSL